MKKFSSYAFWVALAGAVVVFLEDISNLLGIDINVSVVESLILSFCGVLVVLGIVQKKDDTTTPNEEENVNNETNTDIVDDVDVINTIEEQSDNDIEEVNEVETKDDNKDNN